MKKVILFVFILCAIVSALASSQEDTKRSKPSATVFPPSEFDATSNTASTTTETALTTTEAQTNATTAAPTTTPTPTTTASHSTTAAPTTANATTAAPTTANATTAAPTTANATTAAPTTANATTANATTAALPTTHAPITTPAPKPEPTPAANLTVGNYTLKSGKGLCLMAQLALQIRVEDTGKTGVFIVQPVMTKVEGGCEKSTANLTLKFKEGFITFIFNKNTTQNAVYVDTVSFHLSYPLTSGENGKISPPYVAKNGSLDLFLAKVGHSYSCKSESVFMGNGLYLDVTQDRMQAFNLTKEWDFGTSDPCPADRPADYRVAIAVGIVLLILIIIVVVAYLLSRRKRSDGYQSL
ncbi:CD68 molecule precursor [Salmo salar]|uniref:Macrosialin n=1 Tax=Salmo salar TaxID=8030 RepID=C0H9A0_SALSA|nr:CD68 molecule precursor [Salmo salar]ACN10619.1 Macrosialin precursor [Salmo salar]|eukprot:NP_001158857.1 Macrosialin precursor [Salmo salar]